MVFASKTAENSCDISKTLLAEMRSFKLPSLLFPQEAFHSWRKGRPGGLSCCRTAAARSGGVSFPTLLSFLQPPPQGPFIKTNVSCDPAQTNVSSSVRRFKIPLTDSQCVQIRDPLGHVRCNLSALTLPFYAFLFLLLFVLLHFKTASRSLTTWLVFFFPGLTFFHSPQSHVIHFRSQKQEIVCGI